MTERKPIRRKVRFVDVDAPVPPEAQEPEPTPPEPKKPSLTHFAPGWLFTVCLVSVTVGLFSFMVANRINSSVTLEQLQSKLMSNENSIQANCAARNEQIKVVNLKFERLILVFDTSIHQQLPDQPTPSPEVLRLFDEFRKPIELFECK